MHSQFCLKSNTDYSERPVMDIVFGVLSPTSGFISNLTVSVFSFAFHIDHISLYVNDIAVGCGKYLLTAHYLQTL